MFRFRAAALIAALPLVLMIAGPAYSQAASPSGPLVVGATISPPFSYKDELGQWTGISLDLIHDIARKEGRGIEIRRYDLEGLLKAVERAEVDLAAAALSITPERERVLDFSHPYFHVGLGIAVPRQAQGNLLLSLVDILLSPRVLACAGLLALVLLGVGTLAWLLERRANPGHFRAGGKGLLDGMWWSATTMTTVGYGDLAPKTWGGRVLGMVWMFASVGLLSVFIAGFSSALTVRQMEGKVQGPDDLAHVLTASVPGSSSEAWMRHMHLRPKTYPDVRLALRALADGEVDAVVYDKPILLYYMRNEFQGRLQVLKGMFDLQTYGFAFPKGSGLRKMVNVDLLRLLEVNDYWNRLVKPYLGPQGDESRL